VVKISLIVLRAHSRVSPVVGLLPLVSGPACLGINLDRLQNKCTNYKGVRNNTNFGKITGIQEKLDTTCK